MNEYVDLHSHSTASDGTLRPAEVARLARDSGLVGFALTDHDSIDGVAEAAEAARALGVAFLPGIEISCIYPQPGIMHLLGYCVDPASPDLANMSRQLIEFRDNRNPKIIQKLNELGIDITMPEVEAQAGGNVIGRPHMAALLVKKGVVKTMQQAFDQYLGQGGLAYFDKERLTPRQAVEMVLRSGGIAVLAHPVQLQAQNDAQLERIVKDLLDIGLAGIEVIHCDHTPELAEKYSKLANRFGLLKTGGSDFHGKNKGVEFGCPQGMKVPRAFMDALIERSSSTRRKDTKCDS